jgi:hypothetical protein
MSSEIKADKWSPASGTSATIGDSGDTFTVPSGVTLDTSSSTLSLPSSVITGQTAITSLADTDKFLVSDASDSGNLKYVEKQYLPSGGLAFITAVNTTVTSVITFSNCFSSTYKNYAIFFTNINFSSDGNLGLRFGASGTYLEDYKGASHGYDGGQVGTGYNSGVTYAQPSGALFGVDTAANSQQGLTGSGIIYNPFDSSSAVYGTFQCGSRNDGNSQWTVANSWFTSNTDASYTDLRAYSTAGNDFNTHGRIAIYGIVDS